MSFYLFKNYWNRVLVWTGCPFCYLWHQYQSNRGNTKH